MKKEWMQNICGLCLFVLFIGGLLALTTLLPVPDRTVTRTSIGRIISAQSVPRVLGIVQRQMVTCERGTFVTSEQDIPIGEICHRAESRWSVWYEAGSMRME